MTWKEILDYCIGEVGLSPAEFWSMTFAEVDLACKGYETRMAELKELPRLVAAVLLNAYRKRGSAAVRPESIYPLFTDKERKVELMTLEEYEEAKKMFKNVVWQKSKN